MNEVLLSELKEEETYLIKRLATQTLTNEIYATEERVLLKALDRTRIEIANLEAIRSEMLKDFWKLM